MLWVKSLHLIFMVTWFAGLFYLPRLFVYHAQATDPVSIERFKLMERRLYRGIMTPGAVLTIAFGVWLWLGWFRGSSSWLHAKIALVALLVGYHVWCGRLLVDFAADRNEEPGLAALVQRISDLDPGRDGISGCLQTVLSRSSRAARADWRCCFARRFHL